MSKELRQKLYSQGLCSLSDKELLSIIFRSEKKDSASKILDGVDSNLNRLAKMSISDITELGVSEAEATYVVATLEIGRRRSFQESYSDGKIRGSKDVSNYIRPNIADLNHEEFWIIYLNRNNHIIEKYRASQGGMTGTVVDVRLILKKALECHASSMICAHNHPSGNLDPSDSDKKITRQLKEAAAIMEIPVMDHLIITQTSYFSFADEGLL